MTSNDDTSGKSALTISVTDEDGQRRDVTFNVPLHQGKRLRELTMGEVLPPDLLVQLESMPAVMPMTSERTSLGSVMSEAEMRATQDSAAAMLSGFPDQQDAAASLMSDDEMGQAMNPAAALTEEMQRQDPTPPRPISDADLRAVYEHTAKHCPLCGQLIPGNTEGAPDAVN